MKNILRENMKRFSTKNINEQSHVDIEDLVRALDDAEETLFMNFSDHDVLEKVAPILSAIRNLRDDIEK
tara:strand:- start:467 stop:673 length:207 start_codon:yes stop_codon:yes gene_type:complete